MLIEDAVSFPTEAPPSSAFAFSVIVHIQRLLSIQLKEHGKPWGRDALWTVGCE